MFRLISGGLGG